MADSLVDERAVRRAVTVAVVGLLVAFSGCAGLGANGPGGPSVGGDATTDATETTAGDSGGSDDSANATGEASGKVTVVVAGTELPLGKLASGEELSIADDDEHTWRASGNPTLAGALSSFGVEANATAVRYDGTTYRRGDAGITVSIRVNGESVDPTEYFLKDGDSVQIVVETEES
ncbi:hypothetical protein [Halorussus ruber]|uniref:hypothetical protein n=1 Tax=Halorussus ruber TaxID=1126238 RepID=UPI0010929ED1|nr:hypothetical protein [Halorussus ruber]